MFVLHKAQEKERATYEDFSILFCLTVFCDAAYYFVPDINNCGKGIFASVEQLSEVDLDEMIAANVKSALFGMQSIVPLFKNQGYGSVINISSILGRLCLTRQRSAYSAAKAAMNSLTSCYRQELWSQGFSNIQVSLVSPGAVVTTFSKKCKYSERSDFDSSQTPGAQTVDEVAAIVLNVLRSPKSMDVYTREPLQRQMVQRYYSALDMTVLERQPPFAPRSRKKS